MFLFFLGQLGLINRGRLLPRPQIIRGMSRWKSLKPVYDWLPATPLIPAMPAGDHFAVRIWSTYVHIHGISLGDLNCFWSIGAG